MINNNKVYEIMQSIITEKMLNICTQETGYIEHSRKVTVTVFFKYMFLSAIYNWRSYREASKCGVSYGLPMVDHSSLSLKGKEINYTTFKEAYKKLITLLSRSQRRKIEKKMKKAIDAVDATYIKAARSKWDWTPISKDRSAVKLHVKINCKEMYPEMVEETTGKVSDKQMLSEFYNNEDILISDRGYMKVKQFVEMDTLRKKQFFIIRVTDNLSIEEIQDNSKITDESGIRDCTVKLGSKGSKGSYVNHEFRMIEVPSKNGKVRLISNIKKLSAKTIAETYKERWQIEVFFKYMKQYFNLSRPFGKNKNAVYSYLYICLIAYVIVRYLYLEISNQTRITTLKFLVFYRELMNYGLNTEWLVALNSTLKNVYDKMTDE